MHVSFATAAAASLAALLITATTAVAQDECASAIPIAPGLNGPFDNTGMTASTTLPAPSCVATSFDQDMWLLYPSTCAGSTTIDSCATGSGDTVMQVYDGTAGCGALTLVACNDDFCGLQSSVTFAAALGSVYYIRLDTFGVATQTAFNITVTPCAPPVAGDECTTAIGPLVLGLNAGLSNAGMTSSVPAFPCSVGAAAVRDVWHTFTAGCTAPHTFSTCTTALDTVIEVFDNCTLLTSLGCNDDSCGLRSSVTVSLTNGVTYLVRGGGWNNAVGTWDLTIATGTGAGTIVPSTHVSTCKFGLTFSVTGNPNIGNTITETVSGFTGVPAVGWSVGANIPVALPCPVGCLIISSPVFSADGEFYLFSSSTALPIPCSVNLIGAVGQFQGFDFFGTGNCVPGLPFPAIPVAASDITTVTVG